MFGNLSETVRRLYQERVHGPLSSASKAVSNLYVRARQGPVRSSDDRKEQYRQGILSQNLTYNKIHELGLITLGLNEPLIAITAFEEESLLRLQRRWSREPVQPFLDLAEALAYANGLYDTGLLSRRYSHRVTRTGAAIEKAMKGFLGIVAFRKNPHKMPEVVLNVVDEIMKRYGHQFEKYQPQSQIFTDAHKSVRAAYEEFQKQFKHEIPQ